MKLKEVATIDLRIADMERRIKAAYDESNRLYQLGLFAEARTYADDCDSLNESLESLMAEAEDALFDAGDLE